MASTYRSVAVIGLGTFGSNIARELARFGNHVVGIDLDAKRVNAHADDLSQALILDARDDVALREAGIEAFDVGIVGMASDVEASILSTMNLKTIGVSEVWAKASTKNHHRILMKLGVHRVIHPEAEVGVRVAQMVHNPIVRDFASLGNGHYIVNFRAPDALKGKSLDTLPHNRNSTVRCIGVMRGSEFLGHDGAPCVLEPDDILLFLGKRSDLRDFADGLG